MKFLRESRILSDSRRLKERTSVVGAYQSFERDIYRNVFWDPHTEMYECNRMYNFNSYVQSAVNAMVDFIMGGDLTFCSDDKHVQKLGQAYIDSIGMTEFMREPVENTIKTGNGYLELDYDPETKLPFGFYPVADSSRIYINCDQFGRPKEEQIQQVRGGDLVLARKRNVEDYYIQRVDYNSRFPDAKWFDMTYFMGSVYKQFRIYGIPIHKKKIIHFRLNLGDIGIYGRSYLASCLDDYEALTSIERAIAVIAKYKAVPRDILMYGDKDNPADDSEVDEVMLTLDTLEMEESLIVNKPIKRETLSYAGQDINLDYMIKHLSKKIIAGIAPDFIMGMGDQVNRATATVELLAYILSIYSKRKIFLKPLEERILKPWLQAKGLGHVKCWLEFGELSLETKSEKTQRALQEFTSNTITLNEYREDVGRPAIETDMGDKYFSEIQNDLGPDLFGGMDLFGGGEYPEEVMEKIKEAKAPEGYDVLKE